MKAEKKITRVWFKSPVYDKEKYDLNIKTNGALLYLIETTRGVEYKIRARTDKVYFVPFTNISEIEYEESN